MSTRYLSKAEARAFYDHFGRKQDWQKFYESAAIRTLLIRAEFERATKVFELGCGTGAFAEKLLLSYLPKNAQYLGIDISSVMIELSRKRIKRFGDRAQVRMTDGSFRYRLADGTFDRFVSTYVFDLLSPEDIREVLEEAHRLLVEKGRLCIVSLTHGKTFWSRSLTWVWIHLHRLRPSLVGGCRPINLLTLLKPNQWQIRYHTVITAFGLSSDVLIAEKLKS